MYLELEGVIVRPWRLDDAGDLVHFANNLEVARNMRDLFPYPYTDEDAVSWLSKDQERDDDDLTVVRAIEVDGRAVGGVGLHRFEDVHRGTAEIGYWLGQPLWGRGIATAVTRAATDYGLGELGLLRVQAAVFSWNPASARVLQKAGFTLEGVHKKAVTKLGEVLDLLMYARVAA